MSRAGGCARALARIAATILAAIVALTIPFGVLAFDIGRVLFSPQEMAGVIAERGLESGAVRRLVSERLLGPEPTGETSEFSLAQALSYLEPDEVDRVLDLLIPPEWARSQVTGVLTQLYDWMDNDLLTPSVQLDVRPIQQSLLSGGAARLVETILDSWPQCTVTQNEELRLASVAGRELPLQYCEPPEPYRTRISEMTTQALVEAAQAMPPKIDLMPADPAAPPPDPAVVMAQKEQLRLLRALARWGWVLPFSLLGVIMALVVRSLRGLTRWWGIPLLVGGLLSILAVLFASGVTQRLISQAFGQAGIPEGLVGLLQSILVGLREQILGRMFLHGVLLTLGAGILLFVGFLLGRRAPKPVPSPVPPAAAEPAVPPAGADATATKRAEPMPTSGEGGPKGIFG